MKFTVTIRYPNGKITTYENVPGSLLEYGARTNYCRFTDKDGKSHIIIGAIITCDEETSEDAF